MNATQLIEKLSNWDDGQEDDGYYYSSIINRIAHEDFDKGKMTEDFGEWEYAQCNVRGSEGDHDSCLTVLYFKEHDVYLGIEGWYSSQEGSNYEDASWKQYYPKKITKTIYSTKK